MRLALQQPARKPFYLVGRLGDRDLTIAASGSASRSKSATRSRTPSSYRKRTDHEDTDQPNQHPSRRRQQPNDPTDTQAHTPDTTDTEVAVRAAGPRRRGAPPVPDDSERVERRARGDGRDSRTDLSRQSYYDLEERALKAMLRALVPGCGRRPARRARTKRLVELERRVKQLETEKAPVRAAAAVDSQGDADGAPEDHSDDPQSPRKRPSSTTAGLEALAALDENVEIEGDAEAAGTAFDPDAGWRDRALSWERKLASAGAAGISAQGGRTWEATNVGS